MELYLNEMLNRCRPILFEKCCGYTFMMLFEEGDKVDEAFRAVERYFQMERGDAQLYLDRERTLPIERDSITPLRTIYRHLQPVYPMPSRVVYRLHVGGICDDHQPTE